MGIVKILIVDDHPGLRDSLRLYLQDMYAVATAGAAEDAIKYINDYSVNLVLLDIGLPEMDGITALTEIKKRHSDTEVIMMTAYAGPETVRNAFRLGAFAFFIKPFRLDELADAIDRALQKQSEAQGDTESSGNRRRAGPAIVLSNITDDANN